MILLFYYIMTYIAISLLLVLIYNITMCILGLFVMVLFYLYIFKCMMIIIYSYLPTYLFKLYVNSFTSV